MDGLNFQNSHHYLENDWSYHDWIPDHDLPLREVWDAEVELKGLSCGGHVLVKAKHWFSIEFILFTICLSPDIFTLF